MAISRANILRGPAIVQMAGQTFYSKGDIKVTMNEETFPVASSIYGKSGERLKDVNLKISFTPAGMWTTALLAVLYPHTNPTVGSSLFGASDVPVTLHPTNGSEKIVFSAGAITKMPGLKLSPIDTNFKEIEITCLLKNNVERSNAAALMTVTASEAFSDTSFSLATIFTVPYAASLSGASSPWDAIMTEDGFDVDFDMKSSPVNVSGLGMVDISISSLDISVKFKPVGITVAQLITQLKIQGTGVAIGQDISASVNNLTITGGTDKPQVIIYNVRLKNSGQIYGAEALRHDTIEFVATRPAAGAMFSVGVGA